jgi:hypothetical protein
MQLSRNTHYSNSSLLFKIMGIACIPVLAFVLVHMLLAFFDLYPVSWMREIHFTLQNGFLPFFIFLVGSFARNKKFRIPLLIFFPLFFIGYSIKTLDFLGVIDYYNWTGLESTSQGSGELINLLREKWIVCVPLLGLVITYTIYFFVKRSKTITDYIKVIWLLAISYVTFSIYFPIGFKTIYLYEASTWVLIVMITLGLINYFRKPSVNSLQQ